MSDGENQEVSTKVLSEPDEASKKCEEPLVEFKMGSALQQFLIRKSTVQVLALSQERSAYTHVLVFLRNIELSAIRFSSTIAHVGAITNGKGNKVTHARQH